MRTTRGNLSRPPAQVCLHLLPPSLASRTQTDGGLVCSQVFEDIVEILQSLKSVNNINIRIDAAFWGEDYAAGSSKPYYTGVIHRWQGKDKTTLMVMWEGYNKCQAAPLEKMHIDAAGNNLN